MRRRFTRRSVLGLAVALVLAAAIAGARRRAVAKGDRWSIFSRRPRRAEKVMRGNADGRRWEETAHRGVLHCAVPHVTHSSPP
jgi:hypothetical protein